MNSLKRFRIRLLLTYAVLTIVAVSIVSFITINETERVMKNKTGSLLSALDVQMKLSINNYLDRVESNAVLVFSDELNYSFDPQKCADEAKKQQTLEMIGDNLLKISLMENYNDFAIIYRSGERAGRISNGTNRLFGDAIFTEMESVISDEAGEDGWKAGCGGDFRRLYYAKRLHENAILVISVFETEFDCIFEYCEDTKQIMMRLIDEEWNIIYSSQDDEVGQKLPESVIKTIGNRSAAYIADQDYMYHIDTCGNHWRILCSIAMDSMRQEYQSVRIHTIMVALAAAVLGIVAGILVSGKIISPLNDMVYGLNEKAEFDQLTGVLNKMAFEKYAEELIRTRLENENIIYLLSDVDDFKKINDICGHAAGDRVLRQYGKIFGDAFHKAVAGRIGGDEFAAVARMPAEENCYVYIGEHIKNIQEKVAQIHEENADIHVSIGVAVMDEKAKTLAELYRNADNALYQTKRRGKNGYVIYNSELARQEGERQ